MINAHYIVMTAVSFYELVDNALIAAQESAYSVINREDTEISDERLPMTLIHMQTPGHELAICLLDQSHSLNLMSWLRRDDTDEEMNDAIISMIQARNCILGFSAYQLSTSRAKQEMRVEVTLDRSISPHNLALSIISVCQLSLDLASRIALLRIGAPHFRVVSASMALINHIHQSVIADPNVNVLELLSDSYDDSQPYAAMISHSDYL